MMVTDVEVVVPCHVLLIVTIVVLIIGYVLLVEPPLHAPLCLAALLPVLVQEQCQWCLVLNSGASYTCSIVPCYLASCIVYSGAI